MKILNIIKSFIMLLITANIAFGQQNITSISDGNWMNNSTWDCNCTPNPLDTITINHNVVLDTNFSNTGSTTITVNAGASLIQDGKGRDLGIGGGTFVNNGTVKIRYFVAYSGSIINNDSLNIKMLYNVTNFTNNGIIFNVDSFYNQVTGNLLNSGTIDADSTTNAGTFTNIGTLNLKYFTNIGTIINNSKLIFTDFTNAGTITNNSKLIFTDFTNAGTFTNNDTLTGNNDFSNSSSFLNDSTGSFDIAVDFLNSVLGTFTNEGYVYVGSDWHNVGTVTGTSGRGRFKVEERTTNNGTMTGSFDFCDKTPPLSSPYIDFNTGTVDSTITYCVVSSINLNKQSKTINIFPNPVNEVLYIVTNGIEIQTVEIYNILGSVVYKNRVTNHIDLTELSTGIYFIKLTDKEGEIFRTEIVVEK